MDEQHYLTHVDTIPPSQGKGLRLTCHSTMSETLQDKLKTIDNVFKDQITPEQRRKEEEAIPHI